MTISAEKYINPYTDFGFKKYRDLYSALDTAERKGVTEGMIKGMTEGIIKGKIETALKMLKDGVSIENICKYTDLPEEQVQELIR